MAENLLFEPTEENYGVLWKYITDDNITDIDYSADLLWLTHLKKGVICEENHGITSQFLDQFTHRIQNRANKQFNKMYPVLEAQTDELRITIVHESRSNTGRCICIRKSKRDVRMTKEGMIKDGYCTEEIINLIANCVKAKMNFAFCGEPGAGKTECAKFFARYIPKHERVITIEDTAELHYSEINPKANHVELIVETEERNEHSFAYTKAIKTCLRLNPKWIMLSEVRSKEVKYLLEQWSTGLHGFTTLHVEDLRKLPDRIQNMMGESQDENRLENSIYEFINIAILIRKKILESGQEVRYIDQVGFYYRENDKNHLSFVVEDGKLTKRDLPIEIIKKLEFVGISDPFNL